MNETIKRESEETLFYEIKQRYCSEMDENVILRREIGKDGEYTCVSSHLCGKDCGSKGSST